MTTYFATIGCLLFGLFFLGAGAPKILGPIPADQIVAMPANGIPEAELMFILAGASETIAGSKSQTWPLATGRGLQPNGVITSPAKFNGRNAVRVRMGDDFAGGDSNTLALLTGSDFHNGEIEVDVASRVAPDAWFFFHWFARGFVGLAFRTSPDLQKFECFYVRPLNGRADDAERRQRAVQYFSYPDWPFSRLRDEAAGRYEAGSSIGADEWIHLHIVVKGTTASIYVNGSAAPALVVTDLKLGADQRGSVGLWVDTATEAYFANLRITSEP